MCVSIDRFTEFDLLLRERKNGGTNDWPTTTKRKKEKMDSRLKKKNKMKIRNSLFAVSTKQKYLLETIL
jgi:hypothetical protein